MKAFMPIFPDLRCRERGGLRLEPRAETVERLAGMTRFAAATATSGPRRAILRGDVARAEEQLGGPGTTVLTRPIARACSALIMSPV
jgi:hypothetical protein